ncbi:Mobile element protein [hydrothermal vent metagenome]|uniref:Mobile element protein n=1 Tax=hydrothermal vent metagenome TaxID=652676 RepID=A0A3B0WVH0_9ZZZZ
MTPSFNFEQALEDLKSGKYLNGKDGILTPLIKQLTEAALKAELKHHLEQEDEPNRCNGVSKKTIKTGDSRFELDRKILSLFSHGTSYRDIQQHVYDMYGINISTGTMTAVTDQLLSELEEWRERPLESHYPIIWIDAIHYKVKEDGSY